MLKIFVLFNKRIFVKRRAFTLVEVMIAIMLTTVVLASIFMVWSRIRQGIARSNTRQTLQNELRKAANYMQNDFKSIKFSEDNFKLSEGGNGNFSMSFEKFKETEEGKLAQDSIENVGYELKGTLLTRMGNGSTNILSVNCENIEISRAVDDISTDDKLLKEAFKAGREAKLDITITGKKLVPGTGEEMYHVEKTSVVMRNEYYKNINKTYISNFELAKNKLEDVIVAGDSSAMKLGGELSLDFLKTLDNETLGGLDKTQRELLEQAKNNIKDINGNINDTDTGRRWWERLGDWFTPGEQDNEKFTRLRGELANADSLEAVDRVVKDIKEEVDYKEKLFHGLSIPGFYRMEDNKDKQVYLKAYDMKVRDKLLTDAYDKQIKELSEGNDEDKDKKIKKIEEQKKLTMEASITGHTKFENGEMVYSEVAEEVSEESKKLAKAYAEINIAWMDQDEYKKDMDVYNANKTLLGQADTKIELLKIRDTCLKNIDNIAAAMKK